MIVRSIILVIGLVLTLSLFAYQNHRSYAIWNGPDNTTAGILQELNNGAGNPLSPHYNHTLLAVSMSNTTSYNQEVKDEIKGQLMLDKLNQQAQQQHDQLEQQVIQENPDLAP